MFDLLFYFFPFVVFFFFFSASGNSVRGAGPGLLGGGAKLVRRRGKGFNSFICVAQQKSTQCTVQKHSNV